MVGSVGRTRYYEPMGLGVFFFFNHLGNKNNNFRVGLCYIKKLKCPKYIQKLRRRRRSISSSFEALRCLLKWVCSYWAVYAYNKCLSIFRDPIHLFGLLLIHWYINYMVNNSLMGIYEFMNYQSQLWNVFKNYQPFRVKKNVCRIFQPWNVFTF